MTAHAKYSPSSITRVLNCTGSTTLEKVEGGSSYHADHGTKAHSLGEKLILGQNITKADYMWDGKLDTEMLHCAKSYSGFVKSFVSPELLEVEKRLTYSTTLFGTSDVVMIQDGVLRIIDYKHGYNKVPADCDQLKTYAFMAYDTFKDDYDIKSIETIIFQPRVFDEPSRAKHSIKSILAFKDKVINVIKGITDLSGIYFKAGDHCKYCPSKLYCPEMQRIKSDVGTSPQVMDVDKLAVVLDELEGLEAYIKEVREYAYGQAMDGVQIPKFKLVRANTHRRWTSSASEDELLRLIDKEALYTQKMITPTQALKLCKDIPEEFIEKPEGKLTLVPEKDKRQAQLNVSDIERLADVMATI